jgi:opine dehydrogenase
MRVAILGAGAIGLGMAAMLARDGHEPVLWSPSGRALGETLTAGGAVEGSFPLRAATSCAAALDGAGCVVIAVPGYAHRAVIDACAPHVADGQAVIISSHMSFSALYLQRRCGEHGVVPTIVAWGTTVVTGRRTALGAVAVNHIRDRVDLAVLPEVVAPQGIGACEALFGARFQDRGSLLAIALSNLNPQNHLAIALCNFTRMEKGESWRQYANTTEAVGRFMQALDEERLAIARAFGVTVRTLAEHFRLSFGARGDTMGAMAADLAARGADPNGPATLETRYVLEDVPFGLWPTVRLAELAGVDARLHRAGVDVFSALYGRDFAAENDILPVLEPLRPR